MAYGNSFNFNVNSFEQLEKIYNDTKPIREKQHGISRDIRPISSRGQKHARVVKVDKNTYGCVFYDTQCVTYHRNGKIVLNHGGWATQATTGFINACLPNGFHASRIQYLVHIWGRMDGEPRFYILGDKPMTLKRTDNGSYTLSGMQTPTKSVVNREKSKKARAVYKPFLDFAYGFMELLKMDVPKADDYWDARRKMSAYFQNPEATPESEYLDILSAYVHTKWRGLSYKQLKGMLYRQATVYDKVKLPIGSFQKP